MRYSSLRFEVNLELEKRPVISNGEARFAAEAVLAHVRGQIVPSFAWVRAVNTLSVMAGEPA